MFTGYINDVVVTSDGKYFVTTESDKLVLTYNMPNKIVLYKDNQNDVVQLELLEPPASMVNFAGGNPPTLVIAVSKAKCPKTGGDLYKVIGRNITNNVKVYKFECPISRQFPMILSGDGQFLAILSVDRVKNKDCVSVYHSRKGLLAHKILLKYPHLKRPLKFKAYAESSCVVVDSEKGNIIDIRNKTFVRSVKHWTGQAVGEDFRYGLSAPNSGGLKYIDLKHHGTVLKLILDNASDGVFSIHCDFTKCGNYILYYHDARKTVRLFTRPEGTMVANYRLNTDATAFLTTEDGSRLVIGGQDGTVTILVIADPTPENRTETKRMLRSLPSRKCHRKSGLERDPEDPDSFSESLASTSAGLDGGLDHEMRRRRTLRRFRAVVRMTLLLDRFVKSFKSGKRDTQKGGKKSGNLSYLQMCSVS